MSRSLEARLERLERAAQRQPDETVDIFIIGVEPDGTEVEGDPPLVFRCPRYDRREASHDAQT
jgi:hypothetical protein